MLKSSVNGGWDPTLQTVTATDSSGNTVVNSPVDIDVAPVNSDAGLPDFHVGNGSTASDGSVDSAMSLGNLLNDPDYSVGGQFVVDVYSASSPSTLLGSETEDLSGTSDPDMSSIEVDDSSGNPLEGAILLARLEPADSDSLVEPGGPVVGVGSTDQLGDALLTPDLSSYLGDSEYETGNDVMMMGLYAPDGAGGWYLAAQAPRYVGAPDPVLAQTQLLDRSGDPIANAHFAVSALPQDATLSDGSPGGDTWLGSGTTDGSGYASVDIDTDGTVPWGDSDWIGSDGSLTLGFYITDSSGSTDLDDGQPIDTGDPQPDAIVTEHYTPDHFLLVDPNQVIGADNEPAADQSVSLQALPLDGSCSSSSDVRTDIASATSNSDGYVNSAMDLASVRGDSDYETAWGTARIAEYTSDADGHTGCETFWEYIGFDPTLPADATPASGWSYDGDMAADYANHHTYDPYVEDQSNKLAPDYKCGTGSGNNHDCNGYYDWNCSRTGTNNDDGLKDLNKARNWNGTSTGGVSPPGCFIHWLWNSVICKPVHDGKLWPCNVRSNDDCTDFASQVLLAGGVPMTDLWKDENDKSDARSWWGGYHDGKWVRTATWDQTAPLFNFLTLTPSQGGAGFGKVVPLPGTTHMDPANPNYGGIKISDMINSQGQVKSQYQHLGNFGLDPGDLAFFFLTGPNGPMDHAAVLNDAGGGSTDSNGLIGNEVDEHTNDRKGVWWGLYGPTHAEGQTSAYVSTCAHQEQRLVVVTVM